MHKKGLIIVILILLVGVNIGSTFAGNVDVKTVSSISFDGDTLYVGGSGPNNYTKIQDAIDNASDGDTVFVYDDSSPYYETINIQTDIDLIGEDRKSTIIDGGGAERIIEIYSTNRVLQKFTIRNGTEGVYLHGIANTIDNCVFNGCMIYSARGGTISNCEVFNCDKGIYLNESDETDVLSCYIHNNTIGIDIDSFWVMVENCRIDNNEFGLINRIREVYVHNCVFTSNINGISHNGGVDVWSCDFIGNTGYGILCPGILPKYGDLFNCNFINNTHGIELYPPTIGWRFSHCNFINNSIPIYVHEKGLNITLNIYYRNYFNDWDGTGPYHIYGFLNWDFYPLDEPYNTAQTPYDIEV